MESDKSSAAPQHRLDGPVLDDWRKSIGTFSTICRHGVNLMYFGCADCTREEHERWRRKGALCARRENRRILRAIMRPIAKAQPADA